MLGVKRDMVLLGSLRGQLTICKATTSFPVKLILININEE